MSTLTTYLFLDEAAETARVSVSTLRRAIGGGKLKAIKKAGRWRIRRTELERWLETSDAKSPSVAAPARARSAPAPTEPLRPDYPWAAMRKTGSS